MKIRLYKYSGYLTAVQKTFDTGYTEINNFYFKDATDLVEPKLLFKIGVDVGLYLADILFYNYVVILELNRYYFITKVTSVHNGLVELSLKEDVLMTFKAIIYNQTCYVARNENSYNMLMPDERRIVRNLKSVSYYEPTNGNLVNISFTPGINPVRRNIIFASALAKMSGESAQDFEQRLKNNVDVKATTDRNYSITGLPTTVRGSFTASSTRLYALKADYSAGEIGAVMGTLYTNANLQGFYSHCIVYPFEFTDADFETTIVDDEEVVDYSTLLIGEVAVENRAGTQLSVPRLKNFMSKELILADFSLPTAYDFTQLEPYALYEIFIPYYGWHVVKKCDLNDDRLLVFYIVNYLTGDATVYLYDYTKKKILFSAPCNLGVKIEPTISNLKEVTDKTRSNNLNLLLNTIGSALAVAGGLATGNALSIAGGVLNEVKTIGQTAQSEMTNYQKAQINYGGDVGGLLTEQKVIIKQTYSTTVYANNATYRELNGGIYNNIATLSTLHGYTEVGEIDFKNNRTGVSADIPSPNEEEVTEIVRLLKTGVHFPLT